MESTQRFIEIMFSPLGILSILFLTGISLSLSGKYTRACRRLLTCGALLFAIYIFTPLAHYLMWDLEKDFAPLVALPHEPKIDRIVVLAGCGEEHREFLAASNISMQTMASLSEGLRLYRLAPHAKLILSGEAAETDKKSAAAIMADFLLKQGVPEHSLIVKGKSRDTYQNIMEINELIGSAPFALVASACDLRRAVAVAEKLQMKPVPAPAYISTLQKHPADTSLADEFSLYVDNRGYVSVENLSGLQQVYREYFGYAWYRLRGLI